MFGVFRRTTPPPVCRMPMRASQRLLLTQILERKLLDAHVGHLILLALFLILLFLLLKNEPSPLMRLGQAATLARAPMVRRLLARYLFSPA